MATSKSTRQGPSPRPLADRFWEKVQKRGPDDCWEWTASRVYGGYGQICKGGRRGKLLYAHRVSWEIHNGPIPPGQCVLHDCDNPPCCNPEHLFLGSRAENNADRDAKGRAVNVCGESHGSAKLTAAKVREMRCEYAAGGISQAALGRKHGVSQPTVSNLVTGDTWRSVA